MQMFKCYVFAHRGKYPKNVTGSFLRMYKLLKKKTQFNRLY